MTSASTTDKKTTETASLVVTRNFTETTVDEATTVVTQETTEQLCTLVNNEYCHLPMDDAAAITKGNASTEASAKVSNSLL